ncbi:uncharacterized protein LOC117176563 [Belonocnema kinseyi]|uniref:uncharacterized protein LOC117176563 n=1 Tax=Belonocnema kinseyi TaxID=2817044 RepID=UPI00143D49AF|nr:uncharacterized protein LOC117176563 [Belonocnema kinseyi]
MGGVQYEDLNKISKEIWQWCEERNIWIFASYISSKDNFEANAESRKLEPETEVELSIPAFNKIVKTFRNPETDLFASRTNSKCIRYISWKRDPGSEAIDAFTLNWSSVFFYAFSPFSIILRTLTKIKRDQAEGIMIVPNWPTQPWYPLFHSLMIRKPLQFNPDINLLTSSDSNPPIADLLVLLTSEFDKGLSHSSINATRSAISLIVDSEIAKDPRVKRFFKGVSSLRPSRPRYESTWDPKIVLDYFLEIPPNEELRLKELSKKLVTLLALITGLRMQTFSLIKIVNIRNRGTTIEIKIPDHIKTSNKNRTQPLLVLPFYSEENICAASALQSYLVKTRSLRNVQELFISFQKPHEAVSSQTLSRWVKKILTESRIDTDIYSAHSTRHASTSAAKRCGVDLELIIKTAGWTDRSQTFARSYDREIVKDNQQFARSFLNC